MTSRSYSSGDFADVPAQMERSLPERLIHKNVGGSTTAAQVDFSRVRSHEVHVVDLPTRALSVTLGGLEPGQATRLHRHSYETVIFVIEGAGVSTIGDCEVAWAAGDAFYVPPWIWHSHKNSGASPVRYVACENAPLLLNLGVAVREES